jgi:hypothetical protein
LFAGFSWPINYTPEAEYESIIQKVLFGNVVFAILMSGRKYVIPQNGDCSRESNVHLWILKQSPLPKCNIIMELSMEKITFSIVI